MIKKNFLTGLLVLIPLILTFWVLFSLIKFLDQILFLLPETLRPDYILGTEVFGFGVILTFIIILITGLIANNFFGKKIISLYELFLNRLPFVKSIYKSITSFLFSKKNNNFFKR